MTFLPQKFDHLPDFWFKNSFVFLVVVMNIAMFISQCSYFFYKYQMFIKTMFITFWNISMFIKTMFIDFWKSYEHWVLQCSQKKNLWPEGRSGGSRAQQRADKFKNRSLNSHKVSIDQPSNQFTSQFDSISQRKPLYAHKK